MGEGSCPHCNSTVVVCVRQRPDESGRAESPPRGQLHATHYPLPRTQIESVYEFPVSISYLIMPKLTMK